MLHVERFQAAVRISRNRDGIASKRARLLTPDAAQQPVEGGAVVDSDPLLEWSVHPQDFEHARRRVLRCRGVPQVHDEGENNRKQNRNKLQPSNLTSVFHS